MTTFGNRYSVADIKAKAGTSDFIVYKNADNPDIKSWRCGTLHGPVSSKGYGQYPQITEMTNDKGETALVLHGAGALVVEKL
jgi:hypothetical protein